MTLYPFVHVSALELHALSRYPGNRQNDRQKHKQTAVCLHCTCALRHNDQWERIGYFYMKHDAIHKAIDHQRTILILLSRVK